MIYLCWVEFTYNKNNYYTKIMKKQKKKYDIFLKEIERGKIKLCFKRFYYSRVNILKQ